MKSNKDDWIKRILCVLALIILVVCMVIKFYVIYEYADTPISDVPAWAWWWLGGRQ